MTPYEKLLKANDDYHEAVGEILLDGDVPVETKVKFGSIVDSVFSMMTQARNFIAVHYEGQE